MLLTEPEAIDPREALEEAWPSLSTEERIEGFRNLPRGEAGQFFLTRTARSQAMILFGAPEWEKRILMRMLAPDDAADVLQEFPSEERAHYAGFLDDKTRNEVAALLAYSEDDAGGLMNPRFVRVRPEMTVDEAIAYVRRQTRERAETINYLYVLDQEQKLLGVLSFRDMFNATGSRLVSEIMRADVVTVREDTDQEEVAKLIAQLGVLALPVLDKDGRMVGIVTVDDIVHVVQAEATEDIQRIGGTEALDKPYLQNTTWDMLRKRAPWLAILFVGEMFTASAMASFQGEIEKVLLLTLFIPLIVSSGGNSGSQATTLVIRAMALGEVRMRDWFRVVRREVVTGLSLGVLLGVLGVLRVLSWQWTGLYDYGPHFVLIALTVGVAVIGVVTWGTIAGSMLPILLRRAGLDPASASAPFVATLVDVTGLIIYFSVAKVLLTGTLL